MAPTLINNNSSRSFLANPNGMYIPLRIQPTISASHPSKKGVLASPSYCSNANDGETTQPLSIYNNSSSTILHQIHSLSFTTLPIPKRSLT